MVDFSGVSVARNQSDQRAVFSEVSAAALG